MLGLARSFPRKSACPWCNLRHLRRYWRKRFRITDGQEVVARYEDETAGSTRSFCSRCGSPLTYESKLSPHMVNIPRALFSSRTARQPLYHSAFSELRDWAYTDAPLVPLKGFPASFGSAREEGNDLGRMVRSAFRR
jgi:hypothetical protein